MAIKLSENVLSISFLENSSNQGGWKSSRRRKNPLESPPKENLIKGFGKKRAEIITDRDCHVGGADSPESVEMSEIKDERVRGDKEKATSFRPAATQKEQPSMW